MAKRKRRKKKSKGIKRVEAIEALQRLNALAPIWHQMEDLGHIFVRPFHAGFGIRPGRNRKNITTVHFFDTRGYSVGGTQVGSGAVEVGVERPKTVRQMLDYCKDLLGWNVRYYAVIHQKRRERLPHHISIYAKGDIRSILLSEFSTVESMSRTIQKAKQTTSSASFTEDKAYDWLCSKCLTINSIHQSGAFCKGGCGSKWL